MKTAWFTEARFGMFIHWGIYAIRGRGEWALFHDDLDYRDYERLAEQFNPRAFNPAEWAERAWAAGMRYVVFTTKHHDGFCMFDSRYTDFKITHTPYGKDITAELIEAFRARGLKIGLYHSLVDWRHPDFIPDAEHPAWKRGERDFSGRDRGRYQKYLHDSVEQLMTDYGKIDILFFDYTSKYKDSDEWSPAPLLDMIYRLQPEILVDDRLSFDKKSFPGDYCTPEVSVPSAPIELGGRPQVWETCMTMNRHWGYYRGDDRYKGVDCITAALMNCAGKNGNLLLNVGPDETGAFPEGSVRLLNALATWFAAHEEAARGCGWAEYKAPDGCFYTQKGKTLYLYLTVEPMGDMILPHLNGKIAKVTVMRTGAEVEQITHWGYELLRPGEIRIRPADCRPGDVLKIELIGEIP